MIWFTSDWHFGHDKDFIWKARGFRSVEDMDQTIFDNYQTLVEENDDVYILGDLMMGDNLSGENYLSQMKGKKHIILGNHDTNNRIKIYEKYVEDIQYATVIKYKGKLFYLSHYPTLTANYDEDKKGNIVINLFGHTHQKHDLYEGNFNMFHVGVDSNNCVPIDIDTILYRIKAGKELFKNENK